VTETKEAITATVDATLGVPKKVVEDIGSAVSEVLPDPPAPEVLEERKRIAEEKEQERQEIARARTAERIANLEAREEVRQEAKARTDEARRAKEAKAKEVRQAKEEVRLSEERSDERRLE